MNILKTQNLKAPFFVYQLMMIFYFSLPADEDWVESDSSLEASKSEMISSNTRTTEEGLILPKKLVNPCLESSDRQSLHRELLFNQKM